MNTFDLKIVASNKVFYDGKCISLVLPMLDGGSEAFLPLHQNVVVPVEVGEMRITTPENKTISAFVSNGFMEFIDNKALLICVSAELPDEIDQRRAQEAQHRAQEQLRQKQSYAEHQMSKANLSRAMYRLKVKGKQ